MAGRKGCYLLRSLCLKTFSYLVETELGFEQFLKTALPKITLGPCQALNNLDAITK